MKNSKKNKVLISVLSLAVVVLLLGGFALQKGHAQGLTLRELLFPVPQETANVTKEELINTQPPEKAEATESLVVQPLVAAQTDYIGQGIQDRAIMLLKKADETFLKPGWLHLIAFDEDFPEKEQFFSNGDPIPTKATNEYWYLLGENGLVSQAVSINDTGNPATSQTTVYQDGYWKNLTVPELNSAEKVVKQITTLDMGLTNSDPTRKFSYALENETKDSITISRTEIFPDAELYEGFSQKVKGDVIKYTLSKENGNILLYEIFVINMDDTQAIYQRITTLTEENISSAPEQILSYFESR